MTLYFYEEFDDEAISSSEIFITKAPLEPYFTYSATARTGAKSASMTLPTNWESLTAHPGMEFRWEGVVSMTGSPIAGKTNRDNETWTGLAFLIPTTTYITGTPITLLQWHKDVSGSTPSFVLRLQDDGKLRVLLRTASANYAYDTAYTVTQNQWYDVVLHSNWSTGSDGLVETWINGSQLVDFTGATVDATDGTTFLYQKSGLYIPTWRTTAGDQNKTILFDEFRWGDENSVFADVDPAQAGGVADPVDPPTPPSGTGNVVIRSEYANSPTNTSDVVMTDADITGTPAAALTVAIATTGARLSLGMIAGSTINSASIRSKTAVTTTDTRAKPDQTNRCAGYGRIDAE